MSENEAGDNKLEKRDWLAEILLNATSERRKINSIKLPGEPDFKEKAIRVDNQRFSSSVGDLLGRVGDKIDSQPTAAPPLPAKKKGDADNDDHLRGTSPVRTWSS